MTEVAPADRTKLLQSKRAECSAIARSRKRKLCILYEVTVSPDALPRRSFNHLDAYEYPEAERQFLDGCDILQGRTLNELNIPSRRRVPPHYAQYLPSQVATIVPIKNALPSAKQPVAGFPNTEVQRPSLPPKPPVTTNDAQSRPIAQTAISGSPRPTHIASSTKVHNAPAPAPAAPPTSVGTGANDRRPKVDEALHKVSLRMQDNNSQPEGPLPKVTVPPNSTAGFSQHTTYSQPLAALQPTSISTSNERQAPKQQPPSAPATQVDSLASEMAVPNASPPSQLALLDSARSPSTLMPTSTAKTVASPIAASVPSSTGTFPNHSGSLHASKIETTVDDKVREEDVSESRPPHGDRPALSEGHSSHPAMSKSIGEQVEAQLMRDSTSALAGTVSNQHVKTAGVDRTSAQSMPPLPPTAQTTVPGSGQQVSEILEKEPINKASCDSIAAANSPSTAQQRQLNVVKEKAINHMANCGVVEDKKESVINKGGEKQGIRLDAQQQPTTVTPISIPTPITNQDPQRDLARNVTDVALQKPVAEILGERPQPTSDLLSPGDSQATQSAPITPISQSSKACPRSLIGKLKTRGKGRLPTVVFGKQAPQASNVPQSLVQNRPKPDQLPSDDYYTTLFVNGFAAGPSWMKPLDQLLHQAHKTVSTPDSYTHILDNQACRILRRVYQLQHTDKWSLRQPKRCPEPTRQVCHWDILLQEMKWMRTDFREERKWKIAAASNMAYACAEWVAASEEDRKALQVNAVIPPLASKNTEDTSMVDASISVGAENHPTPDLIPSGSTDSPLEPDDELDDGFSNTIAPSAIFALQDDDIVFSLQPSPATDRLLEELPIYGAPLKVPKFDLIASEYDPDASWKRPALPLSRFVEGRMELTSNEPPKKKSRYQYAQEDSDDEEVIFGQDGIKPPQLPPENPRVALFRPENKSIKDRLHAGHQFRPPSDNMPFQAFYESRGSSQWTQGEDDELKSLVREYSYNWSLITSILSAKSMFVSGADRRTPWECFERWVMLEGLPNDMQKTQYFKLWQSRIDQAQQHIRQQNLAAAQQQQQQQQAQQQAQQQQSQQTQQPSQATPNAPSTPLPRRRHSWYEKIS
ncbi:hypothetical protein NUW58_g606 [Xylaria curta]|uniref:Uncharacterized protein n=1 Tax=Xylaria curta TaxID=42375 RepID=A0ACC1PR75_9PEZI|nr:hypothetical protein NUW58_g606 [Xylaria curta]